MTINTQLEIDKRPFAMRDLAWSMKLTCNKNREGSYGTMAARERVLVQAANQLRELGFRHMKSPDQMKPKHISKLVHHWQETGVSTATIKNRMSHLRWLSRAINNRALIAKSNDHYGIERRQYVDNKNKSTEFHQEKINALSDPYVKISAELQREFGLRREEAIKFIPSKADKNTHIELQGSWTKGGKPRSIPVRTQSQRLALQKAHTIAAGRSLIPTSRSYIEHVRVFEKDMMSVGLGKTHGARHLYAMNRFREISGYEAPVLGGPERKNMNSEQKLLDDRARLEISRELGHERQQIVSIYIGC